MKTTGFHSPCISPDSQCSTYRLFRNILGVLMLFFCSAQITFAQVIRITGTVTSKGEGKPLIGVNVIDNKSGRLLTTTDVDGRYATNAHADATLKFTMVGAETTTVKVKNRQILNVQLETEDVFLSEATVTAKRITDKVTPEPTEIEVKGNYFYVRTRVRVPKEMFSHDTRLVVQPFLNNVTRKELRLMRPMVYDAKEYNLTQDRMYDFDMENQDPLAQYVTVKSDSLREEGRSNDIIGYTDSIYVENMKDEYSCDIHMAIENYRRILYRDTTVIARGTVNPLRFLKYSFAGNEITDTLLYPKAELQLRDTKGEMRLRFEKAKSTLNMSDPQNREEMQKLYDELKSIELDQHSDLRSFSIVGTASPDGKYSYNVKLANNRLKSAMENVLSHISDEQKNKATFSSSAHVAPWSEVVKLLKKDSLYEEASAIEKIIARNNNIDQQGAQIKKLGIYQSPLLDVYLPELRKVEYQLTYSIFRKLTINEIRDLYQKDYRLLSRYEFFRLYREEPDSTQREKYCRQALEMFPSFMVAANDLQSLLISRGTPDAELLVPFAGEKAPATVNTNHIIALLSKGKYTDAAEIAQYVPQNEDNEFIIAVCNAMSGKYEEAYPAIARSCDFNNILMLLAMKKNDEAWKITQRLNPDEAMTSYIKAICLNRMEKPNEAYEELKKAFEKDPTLIEIARLDGDVNDLLPENNE